MLVGNIKIAQNGILCHACMERSSVYQDFSNESEEHSITITKFSSTLDYEYRPKVGWDIVPTRIDYKINYCPECGRALNNKNTPYKNHLSTDIVNALISRLTDAVYRYNNALDNDIRNRLLYALNEACAWARCLGFSVDLPERENYIRGLIVNGIEII